MRSTTDTLIAAMRVLARDIDGDGAANTAIAEAADRLEEQQARIAELEAAIEAQRPELSKIADAADCGELDSEQFASAIDDVRAALDDAMEVGSGS